MDLAEIMSLYDEKVSKLQEQINKKTQKIDNIIATYEELPQKYSNQSKEWIAKQQEKLQAKIDKAQVDLTKWIDKKKQDVENWLIKEKEKIQERAKAKKQQKFEMEQSAKMSLNKK